MIQLEHIRPCLEGLVPASIATCDSEGMPNVTYVSHVHYVDSNHVALSFQFFNKTRQNILSNPQATVCVIHPETAAQYRLSLLYQKTEQSGPLFETMKARLAGIASHSGMENVFRLLGADIYQVLDIEDISVRTLPSPVDRHPLIALRKTLQEMDETVDLDTLLDTVLDSLAKHFHIKYSLLMLTDEVGEKLFTVASRGYDESGVGSELPIGVGVIGTAAKYQTIIRIAYAAAEYHYAQAMKNFYAQKLADLPIETTIHYPGLSNPGSQIALPLCQCNRLLGVLYAESEKSECFTYQDEDALACVAIVLSNMLAAETDGKNKPQAIEEAIQDQSSPTDKITGTPIEVRYYSTDGSVFLDKEYLIKGVAGKILWRILQLYTEEERQEFSNRELRLDKSLNLPEVSDNLEARLILLHKRLQERCDCIAIEKCGRGRFRLKVARPLQLSIDLDAE